MRVAAIVLLVGCGSSAKEPTTPPPSPDRAVSPAPLSLDTRFTGSEVTYRASGPSVDLAVLPMPEWTGLPWSGRGAIDASIRVPLVEGRRDWSRAEGTIALGCESCQVGDDRAKLPLGGGGAFAGDGLDVGHLAFRKLEAKLTLTGGNVELTAWTVDSTDVKVELTGRVSLMPVLDESHVEACLRFAATPALATRDPRMSSLVSMTGAAIAEDGMFNIRISGPLANPRRLAQICDGSQPVVEANAPAVEPHAAYADLADAIDQGITKQSETTYEISLGLLDLVLEDPMTVAKGARLVPAMKDGKAEGFKLYAIRPSSVFAKLGFNNGDTLQVLGGQSLTDANSALEAFEKVRSLKAGDVITVQIARRGKTLQMAYTMRP
jgi:hypothetical protein